MLALIAAYLIIFIAFAYFIWVLSRSGLFDTIDVSTSESPPVLNKAITIYYKHHLGPYNRLSTVYQEAKSMIPKDGVILGIYYDDPEEVKENVLQSAVGVVFGEEGKDYYSDEYSKKLTKWGYERMVLPKVDKAVTATQRFEGYFSLFTLLNFTYPKINFFLKKNNLPARLAVEFYSEQQVQILIPLDHHQDFIVPEVMITAEKLAQRNGKDDSGSESTSSESALEEEQEPMLVAGGDAGNDGGNDGNDGSGGGGGDGDGDDDVKVETVGEDDKKNV